jgi:hypothetical protein
LGERLHTNKNVHDSVLVICSLQLAYQFLRASELPEEKNDLDGAEHLITFAQLGQRVNCRKLKLLILVVLEYFKQDIHGEQISELLDYNWFGFH